MKVLKTWDKTGAAKEKNGYWRQQDNSLLVIWVS